MGRKPKPKPDDPAQSKRFTDMAREVGADADERQFERAFRKIATAKPTPRKSKNIQHASESVKGRQKDE